MKVSVYIATSLDGFIARNDGAIDWLNEANNTVSGGEDYGFSEFMKSVDTLIMGRKTYEQVLSFGEWPYGKTPVIVMSRSSISFPSSIPNIVTHSLEAPRDLLERLSVEGIQHVYIDGGFTIQSFINDNLVTDFTITKVPILLGEGLRLFGKIKQDIKLKHVATKAFPNGFVKSTYET